MLEGFERVPPNRGQKNVRLDKQGRLYIPVGIVKDLQLKITEPRYSVFFNPKTTAILVKLEESLSSGETLYPVTKVKKESSKTDTETWYFNIKPAVIRYNLFLSSGTVPFEWNEEKRYFLFDMKPRVTEPRRKVRDVESVVEIEHGP